MSEENKIVEEQAVAETPTQENTDNQSEVGSLIAESRKQEIQTKKPSSRS